MIIHVLFQNKIGCSDLQVADLKSYWSNFDLDGTFGTHLQFLHPWIRLGHYKEYLGQAYRIYMKQPLQLNQMLVFYIYMFQIACQSLSSMDELR